MNNMVKYVLMVATLNIIALSITDGLEGQKRVYLTPTGREKVKRYLQRRHREYLQSEYPDNKKRQFYTNTWAVQVDPPSKEVADTIAKKHGFINIGQIGNQNGYFHFKHVETSSKIEKRDHIKTGLLINEKQVLKATQQKVLERFKRDGYPTDPEFKKMWYLHNNGQGHSPGGVDLKVSNVWRQGYTGKGIVISVLDDGLDHTHPDLQPNYDEKASCDLNDNDDDPMPRDTDPDNCHGTRCAGEAVAAANNSICGVGVAYNAKVGGVRMLDGQATDALEAAALGFKNDHVDIYINCWGPKDDGKTFGKPGPIATNALKKAAIEGRDKKGNIFVWATGNGGLTDDDCNCDGYTTSIYTISIGCIGDHGTSAYYTEKCSSTLAVTFNGASHREGRENPMVTTDLYHGCTEEFKGTSASAPLAAGVIALVLEANKDLNWRQVQDAIVRSAQITSPVDDGWKRNGADFHYNLKFGFGRLDAEELVKVAKNMKPNSMGKHVRCVTAKNSERSNIPLKSGAIRFSTRASECLEGEEDDDIPREMPKRLEHVVLTISFVAKRRGDISIKLFSPAGTESEMLSTRKYDDSTEGLDEWKFMTVFNWGEEDHQKGDWHIQVANNPDDDVEASSFASDSNNDVESLEEDVIDAQMKSKHKEWDQRREKDPFFSLPYPKGVRRSDIPNIERTKDDNMVENNKDYREELLEEIDDLISRKSTIPRPRGETVGRLLEVKENNRIKEVPIEKDSRARIPHRHNKKTSHLFKKVQVQEEETGEPRVQINAGYEKADIECLNGESCSGVVLGWKLTLYGGVPS